MRWRSTAVAAALVSGLLAGGATPAGAFTQLQGPAGCVAQPDADHREGGCAHGRALLGAEAVAVSPDGRNVYVASQNSDAVTAFTRDPSTGALAELGCVSQNATNGFDGTGGECADGKALDGASGIAVSPDGAHVYVASQGSNALAIFSRDPSTGELTQVGCIEEFGEQVCYDGRGLLGAISVAVAPDGRHVYVASPGDDAVGALTRDPETGLLLSQGCISDDGADGACTDGVAMVGTSAVAVAPDGSRVLATASRSQSLVGLARDGTSGALGRQACLLTVPLGPSVCSGTDQLSFPVGVAIAPDGRHAYVASGLGRVSAVSIDPDTGELAARGCVEDPDASADEEDFDDEDFGEAGASGESKCATAPGVLSAAGVAVTPDGAKVLVAGNALSVFTVSSGGAALAPENCVTDRGGACENGVGLRGLRAVAVSPDGRNAYVASSGSASVTAFGEGATPAGAAARLRGRSIVVRLRCAATRRDGCSGRVAFRRGHGRAATALGSRGFRVAGGRSAAVSVPVPARVRRTLARHRRTRVTAVVTEPGALLRPVPHAITLTGAAR